MNLPDVGLLCRIQFALTAAFHFLFPPISIGLAWILVNVECRMPCVVAGQNHLTAP